METFLTTNGLPIYATGNTEYQGDASIEDVMKTEICAWYNQLPNREISYGGEQTLTRQVS